MTRASSLTRTPTALTIRITARVVIDLQRVHARLTDPVDITHVDVSAEVVDLQGEDAALLWPDRYRLQGACAGLHAPPSGTTLTRAT